MFILSFKVKIGYFWEEEDQILILQFELKTKQMHTNLFEMGSIAKRPDHIKLLN